MFHFWAEALRARASFTMFPSPTVVNVETGVERKLHHPKSLTVYKRQIPLLTHSGHIVGSRNKLLLFEATEIFIVICYHSITFCILTDIGGK